MFKKLFFSLALSALLCIGSRAQIFPGKIVQFSGIVMTSDSLIGIPYVAIFNKTDHRGTTSREDGYFSFVAREGDTVQFAALGFKSSTYYIPKGLEGDKYSAIQLMSREPYWLDTILVYPNFYPSREDFKRAFISVEVPLDQLEIARRNLDRDRMRELGESMAMDGQENSNYFIRKEAQRFYYAGQLPPQNIFNIMSWVKFFQAWKNGDFKRKKKAD